MEKEAYKLLYNIEKIHWWFIGRRNILGTLIENFVVKRNNRQLVIYDVGCSTGMNLSFFKKYGCVFGVDFYEEALNICREEKSIKTVQADARKLPFAGESCDLLIALDLIEHLEEDRIALKEFNRVLKKDGYLIISVPAYKFLWSGFDIYSHHFRRYDVRELKEKINQQGFRIKKISYINCFLFFLILIVRFCDKLPWINKNNSCDLIPPTKIINKIFEKIFSSEQYFINKVDFPFGSSICCVAQKM